MFAASIHTTFAPPPAENALTPWLRKHGKHFIAHAVYPDNVAKVLASGRLLSSEAQLRTHETVSYEKGFSVHQRGKLDITEAKKFIQDHRCSLPPVVKFMDFMPLESARKFDFITQESYSRFKNRETAPHHIQLKNGHDYTVRFISDDFPCIEGIPYPFDLLWSDEYRKSLSPLSRRFGIYEHPIQIIMDMLSTNPIDQRLAPLWPLYQSLCLSGDYSECWLHLFNCRKTEITLSKLSDTIRASYNDIAWNYGDVVILIGEPDRCISYLQKVRTALDKVIRPNDTREIRPGQEVSLLHPFENQGNFYSHALSEKNTLVIGPREILAPYRNRDYTSIAFEDMTEEQRQFFRVPTARLCMKEPPSIAELTGSKNSLSS